MVIPILQVRNRNRIRQFASVKALRGKIVYTRLPNVNAEYLSILPCYFFAKIDDCNTIGISS